MKHYIVAFLLLMGAATATEQPAPTPPSPNSQPIIGADKVVQLGELVDLSVQSQTTAKDVVKFSTDWSVFDLETRTEKKFKFYREQEDSVVKSEGIVFGAGTEPKELIVHCAVTYLLVSKEMDKIVDAGTKTVLLKAKIVIGGGLPKPNPTPSPVDPKFPNEKLGLSTKVYKTVMERGPPATRKVGSAALSTSFRGTQSQIASGTLKDTVDILKKSTAANASAINAAGLKREEWLPVFTVLQDELFSLYEGNKISTAADLGSAFLEIADAFDAVR